ncbi:MAG TPA: TOBE domain-containing protein [Bryobacteraceae bacterium]|jgi:translation initiation factor IF-1|nr:TOBE domain-containing protein [Bryobacteraceae bacterium]
MIDESPGLEKPGPQGRDERTADGIVAELLPSALVRVKLEGEHQLIAHSSSSQRANFVRLRVGDRVRVAVSAQDRTRGRILELLTKGQSV